MEKGFRISTVSGIADFQGWNVGLQSLGFGIPQAKNSRVGDSDYFTCSEKFKTLNNDLLYVESFCPIKEAGYVVRLYIIPKTFLAGRNSILSLLDTEAKTKGKPTKLVCYCLQSFVYLRHFQTCHSRPRSARGPRKKPSIYRDFERGTQRLFSVKYLFGEANIA